MTDDPVRAPLAATAVRERFPAGGAGLWTSVDIVSDTGSTNTDLIAAARAGAVEGRVLVAEHQRAGRGRSGRQWYAPPGAALLVSVLLRPGAGTPEWKPAPATRWGWLPLLAGVALAEAVRERTGLPVVLKWPNDLLVGGAKCAGILADAAGEAVVIGVGLNVTVRPEELPPSRPGALPVTSLGLAGAGTADRQELLLALLERTAHWYAAWRARSGDALGSGLHTAYVNACATVGQPVRALLPGGVELTGHAETVDAQGRLVLRTGHGTRTLAAGEVTHLRRLDPAA